MSDRLPIGRFAQLARLTVKALRHYDEIGLLKPAAVDPVTGYRYYTLAQAPVAARIAVLRQLEMPLADIQRALDPAAPHALVEALKAHRARVATQAADLQEVLCVLDGLIAEDQGALHVVTTLCDLPEINVLCLKKECDLDEMKQSSYQSFVRVWSVVGRDYEEPSPPFTQQCFGEQAERGEVCWCLPVHEPVAGDTEVEAQCLVSCKALVAEHHGPSASLGQTYRALWQAMESQGLKAGCTVREVYVRNPANTPNPSERLTRVCWEVC